MMTASTSLEQETLGVGESKFRSIAIVEDDADTRTLLVELLNDIGFTVHSFSGPLDFLSRELPCEPSCILLDVRLPGISGLDLQERLVLEGCQSEIVLMTAFADVNMTVRAMKSGAFDFLQKPFREQDVLDAVCRADLAYRHRLPAVQALATTDERLNSLTTREREVLSGVVDGLLNKQIAAALGISEVMVKVHRGSLMRKMKVKNLAHLFRQIALHPRFQMQKDPIAFAIGERWPTMRLGFWRALND